MKIGIIAAMPQELKILVEALQNGEKHRVLKNRHRKRWLLYVSYLSF